MATIAIIGVIVTIFALAVAASGSNTEITQNFIPTTPDTIFLLSDPVCLGSNVNVIFPLKIDNSKVTVGTSISWELYINGNEVNTGVQSAKGGSISTSTVTVSVSAAQLPSEVGTYPVEILMDVETHIDQPWHVLSWDETITTQESASRTLSLIVCEDSSNDANFSDE